MMSRAFFGDRGHEDAKAQADEARQLLIGMQVTGHQAHVDYLTARAAAWKMVGAGLFLLSAAAALALVLAAVSLLV